MRTSAVKPSSAAAAASFWGKFQSEFIIYAAMNIGRTTGGASSSGGGGGVGGGGSGFDAHAIIKLTRHHRQLCQNDAVGRGRLRAVVAVGDGGGAAGSSSSSKFTFPTRQMPLVRTLGWRWKIQLKKQPI